MTIAAFTGIGSIVAGVWFVADLTFGISDRIDNAVGKPLIKMYDGLY